MCLAIPGKIISIIDTDKARISFSGSIMYASLALCLNAKVGDYGLVHAGFVLEIIDEERAKETIRALGEMT